MGFRHTLAALSPSVSFVRACFLPAYSRHRRSGHVSGGPLLGSEAGARCDWDHVGFGPRRALSFALHVALCSGETTSGYQASISATSSCRVSLAGVPWLGLLVLPFVRLVGGRLPSLSPSHSLCLSHASRVTVFIVFVQKLRRVCCRSTPVGVNRVGRSNLHGHASFVWPTRVLLAGV